MIGPPSTLRDYPLVSLLDDALDLPAEPPPCERLPDEPAEDFARRVTERDEAIAKAAAEFHRRFEVAGETGQWDGLIKPGATPTLFVMRQVPGPQWRTFERVAGELGGRERSALAFRLALLRVEGCALPFKLTRAEHVDANGNRTGLGEVVDEQIVAYLDSVAKRHVDLLGFAVLRQRGAPLGK